MYIVLLNMLSEQIFFFKIIEFINSKTSSFINIKWRENYKLLIKKKEAQLASLPLKYFPFLLYKTNLIELSESLLTIWFRASIKILVWRFWKSNNGSFHPLHISEGMGGWQNGSVIIQLWEKPAGIWVELSGGLWSRRGYWSGMKIKCMLLLLLHRNTQNSLQLCRL